MGIRYPTFITFFFIWFTLFLLKNYKRTGGKLHRLFPPDISFATIAFPIERFFHVYFFFSIQKKRSAVRMMEKWPEELHDESRRDAQTKQPASVCHSFTIRADGSMPLNNEQSDGIRSQMGDVNLYDHKISELRTQTRRESHREMGFTSRCSATGAAVWQPCYHRAATLLHSESGNSRLFPLNNRM